MAGIYDFADASNDRVGRFSSNRSPPEEAEVWR
jgi:hypothetical protein